MRRCAAVLLSLLLAVLALGAFATSAAADTGPDLVIHPVVTLPYDTVAGRDPNPIDPGGPFYAQLFIDNDGDTTVGATLRITLDGFDPASLVVKNFSDPAPCVADATGATCTVPDLSAGAFADPNAHDLLWTVEARQLPGAVTGDDLSIAFDLQPLTGTDANPADNTQTLDYVVRASADLRAAIGPAPAVLVAGTPTTFTLSVSNAGPEPAVGVVVDAILQTNDAGFVVTTSDPASAVTTNGTFSTVTWTVGDLAVGAGASTTFAVTAAAAGLEAVIGVGAGGTTFDPVACYDRACNFDSSTAVTVRATGGGGSGSTGGTGSGTRPVLAVTGSDDVPLTVTGLGLLAAGGVLLVAARRRRRV